MAETLAVGSVDGGGWNQAPVSRPDIPAGLIISVSVRLGRQGRRGPEGASRSHWKIGLQLKAPEEGGRPLG